MSFNPGGGGGSALSSQTDVALSNPTDSQSLVYDGGTSKWKNATQVVNVNGKTGAVTLAESDVTNLTTDLAAKAPLASPTFTGTVTVPTPVNTTDPTTKTYVDTAVSAKATDTAVVHNTGAETVAGVKTFTSTIAGSVNGNAATVTTNANQTGDVTSSGNATTIASNAVSNAKAAQMAANTLKGNNTGSTANASDLSVSQATAMLSAVVGDSGSGGTKGLVPAPGAGDAAAGKYLKADGTWATVSGGGASPLTTKGDLYGFSSTNARLPVGSDTQVLTADSTQTLGVKWAAAPSGAVSSVAGRTGAVVLNQTDIALTTTSQTASYTLVLADANTVVEANSSSAIVVTVPNNGTVAYPVGTVIEICQMGTGQLTLSPASSVQLHTPTGTLVARSQYSCLSLRNRAVNDWIVGGDLG